MSFSSGGSRAQDDPERCVCRAILRALVVAPDAASLWGPVAVPEDCLLGAHGFVHAGSWSLDVRVGRSLGVEDYS